MNNPFYAAPVTEFSSEDEIQNQYLNDMQDDYLDEICDISPEIEHIDKEFYLLDEWEIEDGYNYYNSCNYGTNFAAIDF